VPISSGNWETVGHPKGNPDEKQPIRKRRTLSRANPLRTRALVAFILVVQFAAGCDSRAALPPEAISRRDELLAAIRVANPGDVIDLNQRLGPDWDKLGLLPPYTSNEEAQQALGFEFNAEGSPTFVQDNGAVVVLAKDDRFVAWFVLPWDQVDTGTIGHPLVVKASDARFTVAMIQGQRSLTRENVAP
jgi:hypothetical protein